MIRPVSTLLERLAAFDPFGSTPEARLAGSVRRYFVLDAFTDTPLAGNQVAVLTDARELREEEMQLVARELNLSETVFVLPPEAAGDARIRIFTPGTELPFAGHPVLGCAVLLGSALAQDSITLETGIGPVPVVLHPMGDGVLFGWMRQPVPAWRAYEREAELLAALGLERSELSVEAYDNGPRHVYVALGDEPRLAALEPDMQALGRLGRVGVSCFAGSGTSWRNRMFAPGLGVPEDPATGSAAGPLAVHLVRHGRIGPGTEIEISQGTEIGRPSLLHAIADVSDGAIERVEVGGAAVIVGRGELLVRR
ncbi:MAG TPA: PhzF family phenazine biosynthesis protein [Solirubrobacteraceae bacterium]